MTEKPKPHYFDIFTKGGQISERKAVRDFPVAGLELEIMQKNGRLRVVEEIMDTGGLVSDRILMLTSRI